MIHLVDVVMNKFHYFSRFIIKSTMKCCDRFNTFPLYEKQPGWISRVSVTCPIKVWAKCPARHKQTMQRRRYASTMRMDPLAECCSFTAHNPQQSQLKQQFSSYLIFLIRPVLGPRKTTTRSCAAVPYSHPPPRPGRGAQCGTFLLTRRVVPGHVRSGGSDGARVELWTPRWRW